MNSYATLINRRIVVPSQKTSYVAVDMHYFASCHNRFIANIAFDAAFYLATYPDIAGAIADGTVASAQAHYVRFGYYEHRLPYAIAVDEAWYLQQYPDIARSVASGDSASGQAHFLSDGFREGRLPHAHFSLRTTDGQAGD